MELTRENFTSYPQPGACATLHRMYRERVKHSLLQHIRSAQSGLNLDLSIVMQKYESLDTQKKFSPCVYQMLGSLRDAMASRDVTPTLDALFELKNSTETAIYDAKYRAESILTEHWEKNIVHELRSSDTTDHKGRTSLIHPLILTDLRPYEKTISESLAILKEIEPLLFEEYTEYTTRLKLFHGRAMVGATSAKVFGAIYLRLPDSTEHHPSFFLEHLIHEAAHLHLNAMIIHDNIFLNPAEARYKAPIRVDPRPMFGVFHATFVLCRMVRFYQKLTRLSSDAKYKADLLRFEGQYTTGLEVIDEHGQLTANGAHLYQTIRPSPEGQTCL